jgi:hypothetical protein
MGEPHYSLGACDDMDLHLSRQLVFKVSLILLVAVCARWNEADGQTISSVAPSSAPVGATITIAGSGFGASQGNSMVSIGAVSANATAWTDASITVEVPYCVTTGAQDVTVAVNGKASVTSSFNVAISNPWSDACDEDPVGVTFVGGYEQGYESAQNASSDAFLAVYGRRLFGNVSKRFNSLGPFFSVRLQTAPQASGTYSVVSVFNNPTGGVTTNSLNGVGQAVDMNVGLESQFYVSPGGRASLSIIFGGGWVTPVLGNTIQEAFTMPSVGTVECAELQSRLVNVLSSNKAAYGGITTTAPSNAVGSSCFWNTTAGTTTAIGTLAYGTPDQVNFFGKAFAGIRIINRWPSATDQSGCPCERGYVDFAVGQNASITGGLMRHVVFSIDSLYPLSVPSVSFIYLFGSIDKRLGDNTPSLPPLILAAETPLPTSPSASVLTIPLTQPDRDYYRIGAGVSINRIFSAIAGNNK